MGTNGYRVRWTLRRKAFHYRLRLSYVVPGPPSVGPEVARIVRSMESLGA